MKALTKREWNTGFGLVAAIATGLSIGVAIAPAPVQAQEEEVLPPEERRGTTVLRRQHPEVDPLGIRLGGFMMFPRVEFEEQYDDNIFADEEAEIDDLITVVRPGMALFSNWGNHQLRLDYNSEIGRYASNDAEDYEDHNVLLFTELDITREIQLQASGSFALGHEQRGSPDDVGGEEPTGTQTYSGKIGYQQRITRYTVRVEASKAEKRFDNVPAAGGVDIINTDRDRSEEAINLRVGRRFTPEYEIFFSTGFSRERYKERVDQEGFQRDAEVVSGAGGVNFDFSGVTFGEISAGVQQSEYADPAFESVLAPWINAAVTTNVTRLTTVKGFLRTAVRPTTIADASSFSDYSVGGSVDHELRRNAILSTNISFNRSDYDGIDRVDNQLTYGLKLKYMMNRNAHVNVGYNYVERLSNVNGSDYRQNVFSVNLRVHF